MFPRKYGVKSRDTGTVGAEGHRYRLPWTAAYWAWYFEFVEARAGIKSNGWVVEEYVPKYSKKWVKIMSQRGE